MTHRILLPLSVMLAPAVALADITPPTAAHLVQEVYATGVQIYSCEVGEQGPTWIFKSPEADLATRKVKCRHAFRRPELEE